MDITEEIEFYEMLAKLRDNFNGIAMAIDEVIQKKSKAIEEKPTTIIDFDIAKINWAETHPGKNGEKTWYADANVNKDSVDFKKLWESMKKAREAKGNPEPFYFWTKMPEGRGFLWFDQSGNGIYRRLKK